MSESDIYDIYDIKDTKLKIPHKVSGNESIEQVREYQKFVDAMVEIITKYVNDFDVA